MCYFLTVTDKFCAITKWLKLQICTSDSFGFYSKHGKLLTLCIPQGTIWPVLPCCLVHTATSQRRIYCISGHHCQYAGCMVGDQLAGYSVGPWPHSFVSHQQLSTIPVQLPSKYNHHHLFYSPELALAFSSKCCQWPLSWSAASQFLQPKFPCVFLYPVNPPTQ